MARRDAFPCLQDDGGTTEWEDDDSLHDKKPAKIRDRSPVYQRPLPKSTALNDTSPLQGAAPQSSKNHGKCDARRGVRRKRNIGTQRQSEPRQPYDFLWSAKSPHEAFDAETLWAQTSTMGSASDLLGGFVTDGAPSGSRDAALHQAAESLNLLGGNPGMRDDLSTDWGAEDGVLSCSSGDEQLLLDLIEDARRNAMANKRYIRLSERRREAFQTILQDMLTLVGVSAVTSWKEHFNLKAELCLLFKNYRLMFLSSLAAQAWDALSVSREEPAVDLLPAPNTTEKRHHGEGCALVSADTDGDDGDGTSDYALPRVNQLPGHAVAPSLSHVPGPATHERSPLHSGSISNMATQFISAYQLGYRSLAFRLRTDLLSIPYELVQSSLPSFVLKTLEGTMDALDLVPALLGALEHHARAAPPRQQRRARKKGPTARRGACAPGGLL